MKRFLKIFFISFGSLIAFLTIVIAITLWFVFTPKRLTPFVQKQVPKYITCNAEIGEVELTFFSTFPKFGIKVNRTIIINPFEGAPCDTLLNTENVIGIVNLRSLIKNKELIINDFRLNNGFICAFTDINGASNYDIFSFQPDTLKDTSDEFPFQIIDVENVELKGIDIIYINDEMNLKADLRNFSAKINGKMKNNDIQGSIDAEPFDISLDYKLNETSNIIADISSLSLKLSGTVEPNAIKGNVKLNPADIVFQFKSDSLDLFTNITGLKFNFAGKMNSDTISGKIIIQPFEVSLDLNGDNYLKNTSLQLNSVVNTILSRQLFDLQDTELTINDLLLKINGSVENDTLNNKLITDLEYMFDSWQIRKITALIPEIFNSFLEGIDASGIISSKGTIKGVYSESNMPVVDIFLDIKNGMLNYAELPFPLNSINGKLKLNTDFKSPASYLRIENFSAKTPQSEFKTEGVATNLFGDIRADLKTFTSLNLSEIMPFIPDSLNIMMKGNVVGNLKTVFSMSQIEKMELEKMKISGLLNFSNLELVYDSISVNTDKSELEINLPNNKESSEETKFAFAKISSNTLNANKIDAFNTTLSKFSIDLETSDVRDTTRIPNLLCSFDIGALTANMDSIAVEVNSTKGKINVSPRKNNPNNPEIKLVYDGGRIEGDFGDISLIVEKIGLDVEIENDPLQKDIVSKWNPRGSVNIEKGRLISEMIIYPVEFPAIKMHFDPENFMVDQANLKIDKSDFSLFGQFSNVSSYIRGDSILRGNLNFISEMTDIIQVMAITSGIGSNEDIADEELNNEVITTTVAENIVDDKIYQGPYMVPRGIDILLHTNINKASFGTGTASNIKGNIQVYDGILVLDDLSFTTPAADMQVTAIYRTPRKNHIFMGVDLHMLNIEIDELIRLAPDIDTIMPMLRSFSGGAEFHFAFETYTDSLYNFKLSTIRGASSIRGNNLVLMDSETFGKIAKPLRFNRETENKVDSLSVEFTIFREEIEVFPFLIVMDKYKAVVGGTHYLDMSFKYNISLVESPLIIRLSLKVKGTVEKMKYKLKLRSAYPKFYRPQWQRSVENQQLNLRNIIRESLLKSVSKEEVKE